MGYLQFITGAAIWYIRAGFWYMGLGFRLYFAIGLDRDFKPGEDDQDMKRHFVCPYERKYQRFIKK